MRCALALILVAACGGTKAPVLPPVASDAPPGTRWITPLQPWHLSDGAGGVVVVDNIALVAGSSDGVIEEIDLTTGARIRGHALGKRLSVRSMAVMSDGRYLLVGEIDDTVQAAIVDPATFAPTWFALERVPPDPDAYAPASAIELADHSIAIVGKDLPLALYDAKTLTRSRVLASEASWSDLSASNSTLYAHSKNGTFAIDLATGKSTLMKTTLMAAGGETVVERRYDKGKVLYHAQIGTTSRELPATFGFSATLDPTGARIASQLSGVVTVYSVRDGSVLSRFELAPQLTWGVKLVFAGERLVVANYTTIRVADLATKTVTSVPEPYGPYLHLAVDNAGTVTAIGAEVWRYIDGALASTASLGKKTALVEGRPLSRFGTRSDRPLEPGINSAKFPSVITMKTLEGRTIRTWTLPRETDGAWAGDDGQIIASYKWSTEAPQKLVRSDGAKLRDIVAYNMNAMIDDVDVDGNTAALSLGGTATLVDTQTGTKMHAVYNPKCAEYGSAELERGGPRVVTTDDNDAILYDRTTGKALASARFSDAVSETNFIPGEASLLIRLADALVLWDPATNATRTLPYHGAVAVRVSPDRRHAVIAMRDGRLALVDFAALRAAMVPGPTLEKITVPTSCSDRDPFDLRDPNDPDEHLDEQTGDSAGDFDEDLEGDEDGDTGD